MYLCVNHVTSETDERWALDNLPQKKLPPPVRHVGGDMASRLLGLDDCRVSPSRLSEIPSLCRLCRQPI